MYLMGIDVGTTGVKTVLITPEGNLIATATSSYPLQTPYPNWVEQNPQDWWQATILSIQQIIKESSVDASRISGIGLSGQYHGAVLIGRNHKVLRPCILWCDQRTTKQGEYIVTTAGRERLMRIACTPGFPYFTACKLLWVRENEREIYEKIFKILLPKDYIRLKLTGDFATDVTDASGTLFLDVRERKWSREMLDCLDVDRAILP
ncbi:xylulokinase, partial [Candidatus Aerophobetes bacterium]|nr:xylulokinase [Candidatus Aerophobetes bacterium]